MKPVRVGVVGVGTWGRNHARVLHELSGAELVGCFDASKEHRDSAAAEWGGLSFDCLGDLLEKCDAIIVAVPTTAHHAVTLEALAAGCHVLVEKPISSTIAEADEMIAAAGDELVLMVGHLERFNPAVEALLAAASKPSFVEVHRLSPFHVRGLDVSVVLDLMIHDIDILLRLDGSEVEEIRAVGVPVLSQTIDIANARIRFRSGSVANLTASRISLQKTRKMRVFEGNAYLSVDFTNQQVACYRRIGDPPSPEELTPASFAECVQRDPIEVAREEPLRREVLRFLSAVQGQESSIVTGAQGRDALKIALRILGEMEGSV